jgi:hypothetical protein
VILVLKGDKKVKVYTCLFLTENFQSSRFSLEKISLGFGGM